MNKIYKVVWNTVRNCYVVGSELISSKSGRHSTSNGKSSSLKVTLTVLALCGMTALGSGVAPAYAADAGTAVASQYVAVLVNDSNNSKRTIELLMDIAITKKRFPAKRIGSVMAIPLNMKKINGTPVLVRTILLRLIKPIPIEPAVMKAF